MNFVNRYFKGDPHIWAIIVGLCVFSLLAVYSASGSLAYRFKEGNTAVYIIRHAGLLAIGLSIAFILHRFPYKFYARISQGLMFIVVPLLLFTLLFGVEGNNATRWLSIFGMTFQTSDLAKIVLIMFIAQQLARKQDEIQNFKKTLLPMFIKIGIVCALILPANFSTAVMLFAICVMLLFVGRVPVLQLSGLCAISLVFIGLFVGSLLGLHKLGVNNVVTQRATTIVNRFDRFFDKNDTNDLLGFNYQENQAKIAVGTGGFFPSGPGTSVQRNFLPHSYSDFIFAIIIEEWGLLIGGLLLIVLYITLLYRSIVIVQKCDKTFPALLVIGLSLNIVFQAFINMAVAVGLMPVTGQPLPLISMGGTSIMFTGAAFGIILSVSREVNRKDELKTRNRAEERLAVEESEEGVIIETS